MKHTLFLAMLCVAALHTVPLKAQINWTEQTSGVSVGLFATATSGSTHIVVGSMGNILSSTNLTTWTPRTSGTTSSLAAAGYGNGLFVVGGSSGALLTSPDAVTWTARTSGIVSSIAAANYVNGLYIAVSAGGVILTSPDGVTWTQRASGGSTALKGIAYGNGLYVIAGNTGSIYTSTDAITWTARSSGTTLNFTSLTFTGNKFVTAGQSGVICSSPDGINWTVESSSNTLAILGLSSGGGTYVLGVNNGTVLTSQDASTWTLRTTPISVAINSVAYTGNGFIAAASSGKIITSNNDFNTTWNGSTWSNGNPDATKDAIIASNTAPSSFTCKALTINSTYVLNTTGITATVNGNITNSGNGISGTGTVTIAATGTLSGNAVTLGGTLSLVAGTFTTGGLLSIAPGGKITGSYANISGNVTLQQSIIGQRGWRILANPFSTAQTVSTLASTNGISITTAVQASGLTDARTFSNATNTWSNVTGSTIAANTAYSLFIRGLASEVTGASYTAGPTAFTYKATGTLNGNAVGISPTSTSNFLLVGNPYAAPVKTSALTNGAGVSYYVYTISQGGNQTLQRTKAGSWAAVLSSSTTNTIPVLGAIAYKPSSTSSYNVTAATDINTSGTLQTNLFRTQGTIPHLELQVEQDGMFQDKLFVRLDNSATNNGTDRTDLEKFWNDNVNLYTKSIDNRYLGIDARASMDSIPIGISALAGEYVFKVANSSLPAGYTAYLQDNFLNTKTALKENTVYNFSITADAASKGEKRFVLNFSKAVPITLQQAYEVKVLGNIIKGDAAMVSIAGSDDPVNITVMDILGRKVSEANNLANGTHAISLGTAQSGLYFLQVSNGRVVRVKKIVKQ